MNIFTVITRKVNSFGLNNVLNHRNSNYFSSPCFSYDEKLHITLIWVGSINKKYNSMPRFHVTKV